MEKNTENPNQILAESEGEKKTKHIRGNKYATGDNPSTEIGGSELF